MAKRPIRHKNNCPECHKTNVFWIPSPTPSNWRHTTAECNLCHTTIKLPVAETY